MGPVVLGIEENMSESKKSTPSELGQLKNPTVQARFRDLQMRGRNLLKGKPSRPRKRIGRKQVLPDLQANALLAQVMSSRSPSLVARLGTTENAVVRFYVENQQAGHCAFPRPLKRAIQELSGFFPPTDALLAQFSRETLEHLNAVDIMAVRSRVVEREFWDFETFFLTRFSPSSQLIDMNLLVPLEQEHPWTKALEGKRVLIVHPFEQSIRSQYAKKSRLFDNPRFLPDFDLDVLPAVQSVGDNFANVDYETWFEALQGMKAELAKKDFDIALIGAGAYGLFLAAECKKLGKIGVHIGGATQLLFGLLGRRWADPHSADGKAIAPFINEHWAYPLASETPQGAKKVEDGCYWK